MMNPNIEKLLNYTPLSTATMGHYLGWATTREETLIASRRALDLFCAFGIIPTRDMQLFCPICPNDVILTTVSDRKVALGFRLKCPNCMKRFSPTYNTFLENVHVNDLAHKMLYALVMYIEKQKLCKVISEFGISKDTGVAWFSYFRDVATKIAWHDLQFVGDDEDIVEVNEMHLFKNKYNVGHQTSWRHRWVFGAISRKTKKVFAALVDKRDKDTLRASMEENIHPGAFICSDEWSAYNNCDEYFSGHGSVNHSQNFINPAKDHDPLWFPADRFHPNCHDKQWTGETPAGMSPVRFHTQNVERSFRELKKHLEGVNDPKLIEMYIGEWMYFTNILNGITTSNAKLERFFHDIKRAFPLIDQFLTLPTFSVEIPKIKDKFHFCVKLIADNSVNLKFRFCSKSVIFVDPLIVVIAVSVPHENPKKINKTLRFHVSNKEYESETNLLSGEILDYLHNGTLKIKIVGAVPDIITDPVIMSKIPEKYVVENLEVLFKNQELCDVKLSASGKDIKAHKVILASQSPVFKAMFTHETNENTQNQVNITDVDYDVIEAMLQYMYTGEVPSLLNMATKLLTAADKYALLELKSICEQTLCANITVETVIDLIIYADLYQTKKLKENALEFIKKNGSQVKKTPAWHLLMETPSNLVIEILNFLLD